MPTPQLIGPLPGTTPADPKRSRGHSSDLPDDLLREASVRLGIISLLSAALWMIGSAMFHLVDQRRDFHWANLGTTDAIAGASALLSLALFFYTRRKDRDPRFILNLGLAYQVITALALGLISHWNPVSAETHVSPQISWVGAVVLMFAAIVPSAPRNTLVVGLVAASMMPLGMVIARARGTWDFGPTSNVLLMHYPDYILVGVSVVISHVVTKLGQQVTKARQMGSYQLGELLGRGGMGEVYKATHRMLARPAAIKLIRPEMLGGVDGESAEVAAKRFRREAEAAANLRSPHTVELYDFGVTEDETLYFVMELLDGMDLESLVRRYGPVRPGAGGPSDSHPAPGMRITGGGPRLRPRAP